MRIQELFADVITEDLKYEYKAVLNPDNPLKWAKTIIGFANSEGGIIFIGVANDGEAFGLNLEEVDKTKNLIAVINDRHIFPHVKYRYLMRSVDKDAEKFVLGLNVLPSDSIVRYREGDFNETVYVRGDGNSIPATPEEIIALSRRKFGVDNEVTDTKYIESSWSCYLELCRTFRSDGSIPSVKELQNEEIVSKDGFAKSGFVMFRDDYDGDDTLISCRLWKGKKKTGTVLDGGRFKGSLAEAFQSALNFIERNTKTGWRKTENGGREEIRSYPREAIREALVNAVAHRDYSIAGTQIDVDIYDNRIDIVSPGAWLLPRSYEEYPVGTIPSIRRNTIIAACLDVANLMERGGTGFQTMIDSYIEYSKEFQPVVMIYPGFLDLRLFDCLYNDNESVAADDSHEGQWSEEQKKVLSMLRENGPCRVKDLQAVTRYKSRAQFLKEVLDPLINSGTVYRDGSSRSPKSRITLR